MSRRTKGTTLTAIYQEKLQKIDVEIKRVHGRMFRWANRLDKLIKSRSRFERLLAESRTISISERSETVLKPDPVKPSETTVALQALTGVVEKPDDLDVPSYLLRNKPVNEADEKAKAEILAAQAAKTKIKAKASSEKSRAKRRGELRKMPLTGKAALAAIDQGK